MREFGKSIIEGSKHVKELWSKNIQYVSHSFIEAFSKGRSKMKPLFLNEEIEDAGILITGGFNNGFTHVHTIYYAVWTIKDTAANKLFYNVVYMDFSKHVNSTTPALDIYVSYRLEENNEDVEIKRSIWDGYIEDGRDDLYWVSFITSFCLFKKYCDIETKETSPKNRRAKVGGNKYINETDKRIKILDCTWFTNLVVSGAFGVSGHLRWQRYGPNNSLKKLIWVDEFEKQGYTRKAKVLMQEGKNDDV